jgi:hypothetical protein
MNLNGTSDITIFHNTLIGNPSDPYSTGIYLTNTTNAKIQDNIFAYQENGIGSIWPDSTSKASLVAGYNCVYRAGGKPSRPPDPGDVWNVNPLFVNESSKDFHLQSTSPCIDKGASVGVTNDFDGVSRPQGTGYDIGAYEYTSGASTPIISPTPTPTIKPGDANGDGKVDETDYGIWLAHFATTVTGGAGVGDFDGNGKVDGVDYTLWLTYYGA